MFETGPRIDNQPLPKADLLDPDYYQQLMEDPMWDGKQEYLWSPEMKALFDLRGVLPNAQDKFSIIKLYGLTHRGSYANLMSVYRRVLPDGTVVQGVSTDVLTGHVGIDGVDVQNVYYNSYDPGWKTGYGSGYYGTIEGIRADLVGFGVNALKAEDLYTRIDVPATTANFMDHLTRRDFTTPKMVPQTLPTGTFRQWLASYSWFHRRK